MGFLLASLAQGLPLLVSVHLAASYCIQTGLASICGDSRLVDLP